MASEAVVLEHSNEQDEKLWSGGKEPFKASYGKLMMWYFLLSDAFTFAGFLIAYGALRFSSPTWPVPDFVFNKIPFYHGEKHLPLIFVTFMTFVLIASSVTMVRAVQEGHRENKRGVVFWMFLTILGGATFLGCQAWEWSHFIHGTEAGSMLSDGTIFHGANLQHQWLLCINLGSNPFECLILYCKNIIDNGFDSRGTCQVFFDDGCSLI